MSEITINNVCCTCLSTDRQIRQLSKITDGINLLYMLLTLDPEAYKQAFYKEVSSLLVCWECVAVINRIKRFRKQACEAQMLLTALDEGRNDVKLQALSHLSINHRLPYYECTSQSTNSETEENFVDCGPVLNDIKSESDDDIPLSFYCDKYENDMVSDSCIKLNETNDVPIRISSIKPNKSSCSTNIDNDRVSPEIDALFDVTDLPEKRKETIDKTNKQLTYEKIHAENNEIEDVISETDANYSKLNNDFVEESKSFHLQAKDNNNSKNTISLLTENTEYTKDSFESDKSKTSEKKKNKMKYSKYFSKTTMTEEDMTKSVEKRKIDIEREAFKCEKCFLVFKNEEEVLKHNERLHVKRDNLAECPICHSYVENLHKHTESHYSVYVCVLCTHKTHTHTHMIKHLKRQHNEMFGGKRKGSKERRKVSLEERKYPCSECDLNFQNKDLRWKHVQKAHREWFACSTCQKKFAFKSNLERHERIHTGGFERSQCAVCLKLVRTDCARAHARSHAHDAPQECARCDKRFASPATYQSHLKYAKAHATREVCRFKCDVCDKRYRSRGELRDHVSYQHEGRAEHKCPLCGKGLATKRCVARHVRRAHEGIKENARDKICQQCGKAFRDKKTLEEHERIHSGARPLACAACGRAFRQRAALYKHTARLHR